YLIWPIQHSGSFLHGDVAVACGYSDRGLFGQRAQQRDSYASLCGIRHIQARHLIRSGVGDIDDCVVRQADLVRYRRMPLSLTESGLESSMKTDSAIRPEKMSIRPQLIW